MKTPQLPGPRFPFSSGGSERGRLVFLIILAVVFLGVFGYLRFKATESTPQLDDVAGVEAGETPMDIVRTPSARVDPALLAGVKDDTRIERLIREPDPYTHLLTEAHKLTPGDLEALGMQPFDLETLRADPAKYRGQPFDVRGTLQSLEAVTGDKYQEIRGTLRTADGSPCAFSVLREPDAKVGDIARLQGFFFKLVDVEGEPGAYTERVPLIVGRTLLRSYIPMEPAHDLAAAPLQEVRDYDLQDKLDLQEDILFHVLNYVRSLTPEEKASIPFQEVDWADLRKEPERYRGKVVQIVAKFPEGFQWPRTLGPGGENPLGVKVFYDGICGKSGERQFRWIGFEPIRPEQIGDLSVIIMTGVFFKNVAWENKRGRTFNGPLLVPIRVEPFLTPSTEITAFFGWAVGIIGVVLVLLIGVSLFGDRQSSREFERAFIARKRKRMAAALEKNAASGTAPKDP